MVIRGIFKDNPKNVPYCCQIHDSHLVTLFCLCKFLAKNNIAVILHTPYSLDLYQLLTSLMENNGMIW